MIISYNTYIKESINPDNFNVKMKEYLISILPEKNNILISISGSWSLDIYVNKIKQFEIGYSFWSSNYYYINNKIEYITRVIEELKEYIFNYFQTEFKNYRMFLDIPVFNQDKYSTYVYKAITNNSNNIKYLNKVFQYLNDETKEKLKHYLDANNFDLI